MNILVSVPFSERNKELLKSAADTAYFYFADRKENPAEYEEWLMKSEVIIGNPAVDEIASAPMLKYVQSTNAGVDKYTQVPGCFNDVLLCSMSGAFGEIISEYVLAGILALYRRLFEYQEQKKKKIWMDVGSEWTLANKTALILGMGDIGSNTAKRLKAFGVHTIGIRRTKAVSQDYFDESATVQEIDEYLTRADIVIGCLPQTAHTIHIFNEERLRKIKKGGLVVNVGRGSLIVTSDLVKVLGDGHLMGAVLDVTEPEPLECDNPLWEMENVLITPHVSGISFGHTKEVEDKVAKICCYNLKAYINHAEMLNVIDFQNGYRVKNKQREDFQHEHG